MLEEGEKFFRKKTRTIFCPGCGDGQILHYFIDAINQLGCENKLDFKKLVLIGGIGCSGWIPTYLNVDVLHVLHGRAIPVATGIKLANPELEVVVFSGDGDNLSIGGNHFIHAARRNIGIKVVMINNMLYGMTGGQVAPTTPLGAVTHTTPYRSVDAPFDGCALAKTAGATYVSRWTTAHPKQLERTFREMLLHKGFAYVEVISQCPTYFGRYVIGDEKPSNEMDYFLKNSIRIEDVGSNLDTSGKYVVGKMVDIVKQTYEEREWDQIRNVIKGVNTK
ncbi:MAG: thiamine pyrophosphate-dependent enzyme [Thermoplasmatales archaeon]